MMRETKYPGIFLYEDGRVYSNHNTSSKHNFKPHFIKPWITKGRYEIGFTVNKKQVRVQLHRLIYETFIGQIPVGFEVDHRDRNPRNNELSNLRLSNRLQNQRNTPIRKDNKTGYKGVHFNKKRQHYQAYIKLPNKHKYLGSFSTAEEASKAYDEAAIIYFKEFAATNKEIVK